MMGLVGLMVGGVVRVVIGVALRGLLVAREAVAGTAAATQRVGDGRHFHVGRRLRRRVGLDVREGGRVHARVLRTVLRGEAAVAAVGARRGAGARRSRQREPVGATVRRAVPARAVPVLRPRRGGRRRRFARCRIRQRPYLWFRCRNRHAAI